MPTTSAFGGRVFCGLKAAGTNADAADRTTAGQLFVSVSQRNSPLRASTAGSAEGP